MTVVESPPLLLAVVVAAGALVAWALFTLAARLRELQAARATPDAALTLLQREI